MRVGLYARVSTTDKGQDPELQLRELRDYCQRRGWDLNAPPAASQALVPGEPSAICQAWVNRPVSKVALFVVKS